MKESQALDWIMLGKRPTEDTQITREIDYFISYYQTLHPTVFLSYDREAYYATDGSDFRITFDNNILARTDNLSLESDPGGTPLLSGENVIMEIKTSGGIPLWMSSFLSGERIFKTSFSKYAKAYEKLIYNNLWEAHNHAKS